MLFIYCYCTFDLQQHDQESTRLIKQSIEGVAGWLLTENFRFFEKLTPPCEGKFIIEELNGILKNQ